MKINELGDSVQKSSAIDRFDGIYSFLSNFYLFKVHDLDYPDIIYPSVENAFQAAKTLSKKERKNFVPLTPGQSKRLGRKVELRSNWNEIRLQVMEQLLREKFSNSVLKEKLMETSPKKLVEGNNWNDYYWGICNNRGENNLGKLLMKIRDEFASDQLT